MEFALSKLQITLTLYRGGSFVPSVGVMNGNDISGFNSRGTYEAVDEDVLQLHVFYGKFFHFHLFLW